jgi:DeoR/GlpR family transcriptional regulator of sugar metabolism
MDKLFLQERLGKIVEIIQNQGRVSVSELSQRFGVSPVTVRNDLANLERKGLINRTHGGAVARSESYQEPAFLLRKELHSKEKELIGKKAAEYIHDGDSIALDASTTAWHIARNIKDRQDLTVLTNGLFIAIELSESPGITVVMPGGMLRPGSTSLVGDIGTVMLERLHIQKAFFGAWGLTIQEGLTDLNQYEVELKKLLVEKSKEVIAVVDASKWGQVAFTTFAQLDQVNRIITNLTAPDDMVLTIRECGIEVTLV